MYAGEPRIIPALLLDGGQLVKTRNFANPVYVGDAINVLSIFNDFEVDEIVLLDIDGARRRRPADLAELRRYAEECFIPLAYGGGLTTDVEIAEIFAAGYEKVILNSALADDPALVERAATRFGRQAVVGSIDVTRRSGTTEVKVHGGADTASTDPVAWARRAVELGAGELLVTSIDREGTHEGFDLDLIASITAAVDVPVIAHGGAAKRTQLAEPIHIASAAAVAAGSLFVFQGQDRGVLINYPSRTQIERLLDRDLAAQRAS